MSEANLFGNVPFGYDIEVDRLLLAGCCDETLSIYFDYAGEKYLSQLKICQGQDDLLKLLEDLRDDIERLFNSNRNSIPFFFEAFKNLPIEKLKEETINALEEHNSSIIRSSREILKLMVEEYCKKKKNN